MDVLSFTDVREPAPVVKSELVAGVMSDLNEL